MRDKEPPARLKLVAAPPPEEPPGVLLLRHLRAVKAADPDDIGMLPLARIARNAGMTEAAARAELEALVRRGLVVTFRSVDQTKYAAT